MNAADTEITIREFMPGDKIHFRRLNEEWIIRYFAIEPKDEETLADPERTILQPGGRIFFAVRDGETVGCCALMATRPGEFEVAKMAVTKSCQGAGIGRTLLKKVIAEALAAGAIRLFLETNSRLAPAVRLYESLGFRHLAADRIVPSPYARSNVSMELQIKRRSEVKIP